MQRVDPDDAHPSSHPGNQCISLYRKDNQPRVGKARCVAKCAPHRGPAEHSSGPSAGDVHPAQQRCGCVACLATLKGAAECYTCGCVPVHCLAGSAGVLRVAGSLTPQSSTGARRMSCSSYCQLGASLAGRSRCGCASISHCSCPSPASTDHLHQRLTPPTPVEARACADGRGEGSDQSTPRYKNVRSSHWLSETCSRSCSVCAGDAGVLLRASVRWMSSVVYAMTTSPLTKIAAACRGLLGLNISFVSRPGNEKAAMCPWPHGSDNFRSPMEVSCARNSAQHKICICEMETVSRTCNGA